MNKKQQKEIAKKIANFQQKYNTALSDEERNIYSIQISELIDSLFEDNNFSLEDMAVIDDLVQEYLQK